MRIISNENYKILQFAICENIEAIFLAVWTVLDPPRVHYVKVVNNSLEPQCNTKHITFWGIFLAVKGAWLIFGAVLSILTKNIAKEYNDSSSIGYAIYNNVLLGAIAIPLGILLGEIPGGRLTVEVVIICLAFSFTMVVVFFKIWHRIILPDKIPMNTLAGMRNKRSMASTSSLKSSNGDSHGPTTLSASASNSSVVDVSASTPDTPSSPRAVVVAI